MKPNWLCPGGGTVVVPDRNPMARHSPRHSGRTWGANHRPAFACRVSRGDGDTHTMGANSASDADSPDTDARIDTQEGRNSPWNLRLDISREESHEARTDDVPPAEVVEEELGGGHCPSCARGVVASKGGDGFLSRGHRRLACPNCGWESPEWVRIER